MCKWSHLIHVTKSEKYSNKWILYRDKTLQNFRPGFSDASVPPMHCSRTLGPESVCLFFTWKFGWVFRLLPGGPRTLSRVPPWSPANAIFSPSINTWRARGDQFENTEHPSFSRHVMKGWLNITIFACHSPLNVHRPLVSFLIIR